MARGRSIVLTANLLGRTSMSCDHLIETTARQPQRMDRQISRVQISDLKQRKQCHRRRYTPFSNTKTAKTAFKTHKCLDSLHCERVLRGKDI